MSRLVYAAATAVFFIASAASAQGPVGQVVVHRDKIDVSGVGHVRTLPCEGRDVEIAGSDHRITLTGVCRSLDLSGADNEVSVDIHPNGKLAVAGSAQKVRWRSTGEPAQDLSGVDNQIARVR